jgi:hypothetical protein
VIAALRLVALLAYLLGGVLIGFMMGRLVLIPFAVVAHLSRRELMTPDEIMRLDSSLEILLRQGAAPAIAAKVRYYGGPEFRGLFTAANV